MSNLNSMAKRTAASELNHDNWDCEDDPEDAGTFSKADDEALKRRVIKVAKRRNPISSQKDEERKNVFGGFTGFAKTTPTPSGNNFGFLANVTKTETSKTNGLGEPSKPNEKLNEFYAKLKGLNESVTEWIKKHVSANPLINLRPIFKDYDKYFAELEKLKGEAEKTSASAAPSFSFGVTTASTSPKFTFGTSSAPTFSFASTVTVSSASSESSPKPGFSFGNPSSPGKFSFTCSVVKPADPDPNKDEDQDEPPKVEFTPVVEEGHVYNTRCKVFVKKDGSFGDRGVGALYVKPVPDSKKFQLFVRADTNLGNLLCNFILSEGIPMQRMGKKDVMLVCMPTPDSKPPPVPILLRLKSPEEADLLLELLKKHQK